MARTFTTAHGTNLREEHSATGGHLLTCRDCDLRREGPAELLVGLSLDHVEETMTVVTSLARA